MGNKVLAQGTLLQLQQQLQRQAQQLERLRQAGELALASLQECEVPERGHDFAPAYEGARARKTRATLALKTALKTAHKGDAIKGTAPFERAAYAMNMPPAGSAPAQPTVLATALPREPLAHKKVFDRRRRSAG